MKRFRLTFTPKLYKDSAYAVLTVMVATLLFLFIGFNKLSEATLTLLYLVPIVWSTSKWGRVAGMSAALTAAISFGFFFRPPFFGFAEHNLNDTLILIFFLAVPVMFVARTQSILSRAQSGERDALLMYELSTILAAARTQDAVAYGVARFLRRMYPKVALITVSIQPKGQLEEAAAYEPSNAILPPGRPDYTLIILDSWGPTGEIHIWRGDETDISGEGSQLFQDFILQIGQALERTRLIQAELMTKNLVDTIKKKY